MYLLIRLGSLMFDIMVEEGTKLVIMLRIVCLRISLEN